MRSQLLPLNKANQKPEKLLETLEWKVKIIFGVPHPVDLSIFLGLHIINSKHVHTQRSKNAGLQGHVHHEQ